MRLADSETVDYLGRESATGTILATLLDDCDWVDEAGHLSLLQRKINRYLEFIKSGEVYERLAQITGAEVARTSSVKISVLAKYAPQGEGLRFFEDVARVAKGAGIEFSFKVLST